MLILSVLISALALLVVVELVTPVFIMENWRSARILPALLAIEAAWRCWYSDVYWDDFTLPVAIAVQSCVSDPVRLHRHVWSRAGCCTSV